MNVQTAYHALGVLDAISGFFLVWATQRTTADAGLGNSTARWSLWRRAVYSAMAIALFGLGVMHILDDETDVWYVVFQAILLLGFCSFIALRAWGFVTQDVFTNGNLTGQQTKDVQ